MVDGQGNNDIVACDGDDKSFRNRVPWPVCGFVVLVLLLAQLFGLIDVRDKVQKPISDECCICGGEGELPAMPASMPSFTARGLDAQGRIVCFESGGVEAVGPRTCPVCDGTGKVRPG